LNKYEHENGGAYATPVEVLANAKANWGSFTAGLSQEEHDDFEAAKQTLEQYERVYDIFEYSSELNDCVQNLELRITSNNPSVPMNIYRKSSAANTANLIAEMETYLKAYYDLIDQCQEYPDWQKKLRKELGSQISYLAKQVDEDSHAEIVQTSPYYKRFDEEKQLFFK
jgi:shikimate kinase